MESKRVLSVQSHVVHGYVGNKSAVFPLQLHNYEVDSVNSVQLSCHTRSPFLTLCPSEYVHCSGQVLTQKHLKSIYDSLSQNGSAHYDALLTGYIVIQSLVTMVISEQVLPIADVLLPNQFEADSTELFFEDEQGRKQLATYISYRPDLAELRKCGKFSGDLGQKAQRVRALFPKLEATFFGTGDLFSSLTLAYFEKDNENLDMAKALYKIQCTMQAVLKRTLEYAEKLNSDPTTMLQKSDRYELRLIQSAKDVLDPPDFACVQVTLL
ncbi:Pyridoxal kinase [Taenia crassiceps]|uniref:pyridoxal kinase n=1 Tax=Taenia crassiceps TaxID=6207 RepID=A0ABR4Q9C3_9CEST